MNLFNTSLRTGRVALALAAVLATAPALALKAGDAAPAFDLPAKAGGNVSLASLKGQYVYVDFFASWCGPCKQSFPWMNQLHAKLGGKGLRVIAINVDEQAADANKFLGDVPANFTVVFDPKGSTPGAWGVEGMPTSYLVGPDGKVAFVHTGFKDSERVELEKRISDAIGAKP